MPLFAVASLPRADCARSFFFLLSFESFCSFGLLLDSLSIVFAISAGGLCCCPVYFPHAGFFAFLFTSRSTAHAFLVAHTHSAHTHSVALALAIRILCQIKFPLNVLAIFFYLSRMRSLVPHTVKYAFGLCVCARMLVLQHSLAVRVSHMIAALLALVSCGCLPMFAHVELLFSLVFSFLLGILFRCRNARYSRRQHRIIRIHVYIYFFHRSIRLYL